MSDQLVCLLNFALAGMAQTCTGNPSSTLELLCLRSRRDISAEKDGAYLRILRVVYGLSFSAASAWMHSKFLGVMALWLAGADASSRCI
ncbi:hypothetical protein [Sphingomonas montana]|uniref:hypothetical protein n=1 Tax=Sphingomonas montana TaxID=1843236 RepID=UPI00101AECC3|nr:hypothetical protein [Sphingomonas montana]